MSEQDTEAKLAELTDFREDVIRACDFGQNKLTELFNKATECVKYHKYAQYGLYTGFGCLLGSVFTQASVPALSNTLLVVAIAGLGMSFWASGQRNKNAIAPEIRKAAEDRLVALDAKDRGQVPKPQV